MTINQRKLYEHWHMTDRQLPQHRVTEDSLIVTLTKGGCVVGLALLLVYLLWSMTTPAGSAAIYGWLK